jgi:integrase
MACTGRLPWDVETVTKEMIDQYLTEALQRLAPATVANHRRILTTLMRAAHRDNVNTCIAGPFRRVKVPRSPPRAFSLAEIDRLVAAARGVPGHFRDLKKSLFLEAWFLSAYCLGFRAGDLLAIRWRDVRGRRIVHLQHKTSSVHVAIFTEEAFIACERLPRRDRIFGDFAALNTVQQWVKACCQSAGLEGTTKWLRRSCATYAKVAGLSPQQRLGHLTPGLAERHYVDPLLYEDETGINSQPLPSVTSRGPSQPGGPWSVASAPSPSGPPRPEGRGTADTDAAPGARAGQGFQG